MALDISYFLDEYTDAITIEYSSRTKATCAQIELAQLPCFNLNRKADTTISKHQIKINADNYYEMGMHSEIVHNEKLPVQNTSLDFRSFAEIDSTSESGKLFLINQPSGVKYIAR